MSSSAAPSESDKQLLAMLERAFAAHAGPDARIDLPDLQKALGLKSEYLAGRVLRYFDRDHNGTISKDEFMSGVRTLVFGSDRDKLHFAFKLHDHNDDGFIDQSELYRMISISMAESEIIERASQSPEALTRAVFASADTNKDGRISFEELEAIIRRRPALLWKMTRSEAIWIAPNEDLISWLDERRASWAGRLVGSKDYGFGPAVFVGLWIIANVTAFALSLVLDLNKHPNVAMEIGVALGTVIKLDGALILIPMMRRLLTRIRPTWVGRVVPIDEAIDFHRIVGHTLFGLSVAHGAAFAVAYAGGHSDAWLWQMFLGSRAITGTVLLAVFAVMWVCSLSFIRRSKRFELFYFTHLLYVVWFGLAIAHAPSVLFWIGVPLVGFGLEQIFRLRRSGATSAIVRAEALRSGVTSLEIARPPGFQFGAGDYVFLRIPTIAKREWHPFTISSAPERQNLTFHVRSLGNWTASLRSKIERWSGGPGLVASIDGPYGTPSASIFASRFAVLIGAGIGVTPFASVLESIVLRHTGEGGRPSALARVHFFWLNRDQYSFEWFAALLRQLEKIDREALLDIHLCMTTGHSGATALGMELARDIMHSAGHSDIITGLRTHTHIGAPDWDLALGQIATLHRPDKVDVFFCGPPGLAAKLRPICERHDMVFHEERF